MNRKNDSHLNGATLSGQECCLGCKNDLALSAMLAPYRILAAALATAAFSVSLPAEPFASGRFVPERKDDFAFENDKVAFRVYGPALLQSGENSGLDAWLKRVESPIIDKWYAEAASGKSYHTDHGEGYDPYHVGSSLGVGGLALFIDGELVQSNVYRSYQIIDESPERFVVEFEYIWDGLPQQVRELRRVTVEGGSQLIRVDSQLFTDGQPAKAKVAIGSATHDGKAATHSDPQSLWVATWENIDGVGLGTGVIVPYRSDNKVLHLQKEEKDRSHILITTETDVNGRITYYTGFAWEKAGEITSSAEWTDYLKTYAAALPERFKQSLRHGPNATTKDKPFPVKSHPEPAASLQQLALASPSFIKLAMDKVIEFQHQEFGDDIAKDWKVGTFYTGVFAAYEATGDKSYRKRAYEWGELSDWKIKENLFHADTICMGQTMLDLYLEKPDPRYIADLQSKIEKYFGKQTVTVDDLGGEIFRHLGLQEREWSGRNLWWWCDALYMAPPVLTRLHAATGDARYLELMHDLYWDTTDALYDPHAKLFYRDLRFFPDGTSQAEEWAAVPESEKVFWSRGNGWVYAGLIRLLDYLPLDDPYRPRYLQLYREMTQKLVTLQGSDGLWRSYLNRPDLEQTPETSGTAFFAYGLLGGINRGFLDEKSYLPAALRAWQGLVSKLDNHGKLGFAQLVDSMPRQVRPDNSIDYTHGAFLLAASELYKMEVDADTLARIRPEHEAKLIMPNAAWTWYNDERAILHGDRLYLGGVDDQGTVRAHSYAINPRGGRFLQNEPAALSSWKDKDDHDNPSFVVHGDTLLAAYSTHHIEDFWNYRIESLAKKRNGTWDSTEQSFPAGARSTYANLNKLSGENDRIYNFYRAIGFNPNVAWTDDGGKTWQGGFEYLRSGDSRVRPYCKYSNDGTNRIDILYTDGHPREESANNVYHIYYSDGTFHQSDGTIIRTLDAIQAGNPIRPKEGTLVYRGDSFGRGWTHDLEYGQDGTLTAAFITSPDGSEGSDLRYWTANWDPSSKTWSTHEIAYAGSYLYDRERHYAGGISIDPEDTKRIYISSNVIPETGMPNDTGRYQLYRGRVDASGSVSKWEQLTFDPDQDNLRPFVPRGHSGGTNVLWLRGHYYTYRDYQTDIYGIGF
ncbi:glycoside hydrolase family 88 protein [Pelagicoccus sp. NFK12]|uniref:Glycoside hydrolase family 88 protein n=1 Tax=Pelagicoccus enzymogenes TaxID=2773457 RepID=A0A927FD27_9BACT|nr:glycoside hydrolase family 88 protein [Pelagicoccus enzymogenes]MBD5782179.1 glycoside hydrolase family 88 protein [Pelagicoccus enzymogenes]